MTANDIAVTISLAAVLAHVAFYIAFSLNEQHIRTHQRTRPLYTVAMHILLWLSIIGYAVAMVQHSNWIFSTAMLINIGIVAFITIPAIYHTHPAYSKGN